MAMPYEGQPGVGIMPAPGVPAPTPTGGGGDAQPGTNPLACLGGAQPTPGLGQPFYQTITNGGTTLTIVYNPDGTGGTVVAVNGVCLWQPTPVSQYYAQ